MESLMKKWILCTLLTFTTALAGPDDQSDYTSYISALDDLNHKEFSKIIIKELNEYLHRFPAAGNLDDIHFKIATLYSGTDGGKKGVVSQSRRNVNHRELANFLILPLSG